MRVFGKLVLIAVVLALGYRAWMALFPDPKTAIRHRMEKLARVASFSPGQGALAEMANAEQLAGFFAEHAEVKVNIPGVESQDFGSRDEIAQAALAAHRSVKSVTARFTDMNISVVPAGTEAVVDLVFSADVGDDKNSILQVLEFKLKKIGGDWLITRVEALPDLKP